MKKLFYFAVCLMIVGSASSCSKQCVQCQAKDDRGVIVNTSNVICEYDLNRNNFERDYKAQFNDYHPVCYNK
jgi:hypothetical protein